MVRFSSACWYARAACRSGGELGSASWASPVGGNRFVDGGQEHRGVQAVIGDGVSVGVRYPGDQAAGAEVFAGRR